MVNGVRPTKSPDKSGECILGLSNYACYHKYMKKIYKKRKEYGISYRDFVTWRLYEKDLY